MSHNLIQTSSFHVLLTFFLVGAWWSTSASSEQVVFRRMEDVWDVDDWVHLVLDISFKPVVEECKAIAEMLHNMDVNNRHATKHPNDTHPFLAPSTQEIRRFATQVCSITEEWALDKQHKRQVAAFAAGTVFGAVLSTLAVTKLSTRIDTIDKKLARGIVILGKHETRMARMETDLSRINSRLLWEVYFIDALAGHLTNVQDVTLHLQTLSSHTAAISRSWNALNSGRLSMDLLAMDQWKSVVARANAEATKMGGHLPVATPADLLQFPVSFEAEGDSWRVIIHYPVITREMQLYQHLPLPMMVKINNGTQEQPADLLSARELLLISADQSVHKETSRAELASACTKIGHRFICENLGILFRQPHETCLGSLFVHETSAALRLCDFRPITEDWLARSIPPNKVMLFSKKGRKADALTTICKNGTRVIHRATAAAAQIQEFTLEPGCSLTSEKFVSRASSAVMIEIHLVTQVDWDPQEMEEAWHRARNLSRLHREEAKRDLAPSGNTLERDLDDSLWLLDQAHPKSGHLLLSLIVTSAVSSLALLSVVSFLGYRYLRHRRAAAPTPTTARDDQSLYEGRRSHYAGRRHGAAHLYEETSYTGKTRASSAESHSGP
jgi:hypothetical protein